MKIVILSKGPANFTTKRLKEEALKRGHEVRIISYTKCYMTIEKGNPVVYYRGEAITDVDVIIPRIAQSLTKYGSSVVRQFEMQDVFTTVSSIALNRSRDKLSDASVLCRRCELFGAGIRQRISRH
jgi:ribosomal protein S6--L-glutamate ligase